jgi:hypothetical protein
MIYDIPAFTCLPSPLIAIKMENRRVIPEIVRREMPSFIDEKYGGVENLVRSVNVDLSEQEAPTIDEENVSDSFSSLECLYRSTRKDLDNLLNGSVEERRTKIKYLQRRLVWRDLENVYGGVDEIFSRVISNLPRDLSDILALEDRDIIDPYMVAFASRLLHEGNVTDLLEDLIVHKCMMKLEDLIGNVHEEALGRAGDGEVLPEPSGKDNKEDFHPDLNPAPGADAHVDFEEFYQVKNKTGSAKGSDGEKLARQFLKIKDNYEPCSRYYVSVVGKTLKGHRSMGAFLRKDEEAEVFVGLATLQLMGHHRETPLILLELYLDRFEKVLEVEDYDIDNVISDMTKKWKEKHGEGDPVKQLLLATSLPEHPWEQWSETYDPWGRGYPDAEDVDLPFVDLSDG